MKTIGFRATSEDLEKLGRIKNFLGDFGDSLALRFAITRTAASLGGKIPLTPIGETSDGANPRKPSGPFDICPTHGGFLKSCGELHATARPNHKE